jgi:cytochrome c biogenesis protein CcmG/thiol:disulfide interchange protein DsbE
MRLATLAAIAITVGGCGGGGDSPPPRGAVSSPATLARQSNLILGGGEKAFSQQVEALRGHPVVVNKWASWCGPCRFEFPFFQKQVAARGKQVAFLGVDGEDSKDGARRFLAKFPVPYPSYFDPHSDIAKVFHGDRAFPTTAYFDRRGGVEYVKQGGYPSAEALATDIGRYAR